MIDGKAASHQADVAIEVHGLVRLVRQRRKELPLEGLDLHVEDRNEPAIEVSDTFDREFREVVARVPESLRGDREVVGESANHVISDKPIDVIATGLVGGEALQPTRGAFVGSDKATDFGVRNLGVVQKASLESGQGSSGGVCGRGQQIGYRCRLGERRRKHRLMLAVRWSRRIVDQQDDPQVGVLLQSCAEQSLSNHRSLLAK